MFYFHDDNFTDLCVSKATPRAISSTRSSKSSLDAVSSEAGDDLSRVASANASSVGCGCDAAPDAAPPEDDMLGSGRNTDNPFPSCTFQHLNLKMTPDPPDTFIKTQNM